MKTGVEQIADERQKQITKYGFTGEHHADHPEWYDQYQLSFAARHLASPVCSKEWYPSNWNKEWFSKLCAKPYKERLVIAGALLAAEFDRLEVIEARKEVSNG